MVDTNFDLAPPGKLVDGLFAVPIDIQRVAASVAFDGATSTGSADATMEFVVGPTGGCPIFDLRQTITAAWLDGASLAVGQLAHHDFGGGPGAELRIVEAMLAAGSAHSLRVTYAIESPIGAGLPGAAWTAGPRLVFRFAMSDLSPARYLEQWLPANLVFDAFELLLDLRIVNTAIAHTVVTNGASTSFGGNHWSIAFPARFTALSHLFELHASDTVTSTTDAVTLPVSGTAVTIEASGFATGGVDLAAQIGVLKTALQGDESFAGSYAHGARFVAFISSGGMEYEGGTTTSPSALRHEAFHSWWGRGVKPAGQPHGWWDEAWAVYHDGGGSGSFPFDFTEMPVELSPRNPWVRVTPSAAYSAGERFFEGLAAALGVSTLRSLMRDFYEEHRARPTSTGELEAFLVSRSGMASLVDAFHRFVYGLGEPSPAPDLWLRDDTGDPGADAWSGRFWDSADLWVRRHDDGGTSHESPIHGRDNWLHARVRNAATAGTARHYLVCFNVKGFAGTEFRYPDDFLPAVGAVAEFDLAPGESRIVKLRWPAAEVPPAGAHACLLAAILARGDHPIAGRHVWEHNNLAQKNLSIVDLPSGNWIVVPIAVANLDTEYRRYFIELVRSGAAADVEASILAGAARTRPPIGMLEMERGAARGTVHAEWTTTEHRLECGSDDRRTAHRADAMWTSLGSETTATRRLRGALAIPFPCGPRARIAVRLAPGEQRVFGFRLLVPQDAKPGEQLLVDVVKRDEEGRVRGGVAVRVRVAHPGQTSR